MTFTSFLIGTTTFGTLVVHVLIVLYALALVFKLKIANKASYFISKYALTSSLSVASLGLVGSLLYSEGIGFSPCVLCWVGRIFLYPQVILLGMAIYRKESSIVPYILGLSIPGAIVSLYHSYTQLGGFSITACTAVGGACSKVYVLEYGYITIPMMAFTSFLLIIISMLVRRNYIKRGALQELA